MRGATSEKAAKPKFRKDYLDGSFSQQYLDDDFVDGYVGDNYPHGNVFINNWR